MSVYLCRCRREKTEIWRSKWKRAVGYFERNT